jgi:hypothetical protein
VLGRRQPNKTGGANGEDEAIRCGGMALFALQMNLAKLPIMQMIANAILGNMQGRHQLGADKAYEKQYEKLFIYFHCPMRWSDHSDCVKGA